MLERCLPIETEQQGPTYPQGPNPQRLIKGTNQQGGVIHRMKYIKNIKKRGLYHHFFFASWYLLFEMRDNNCFMGKAECGTGNLGNAGRIGNAMLAW